MVQEEKQLLLKDLCARLPYQPKLQIYYEEMSGSGVFDEELWEIDGDGQYCNGGRRLEDIKPYLRPMSSMTEEEEKEIRKINRQFINDLHCPGVFSADDGGCAVIEMVEILNYLNAHHFDYRGLIPMGLALEAPKDMY